MTPLIALGILLAHLTGDYLIQSHWMATHKVTRWRPAVAHGITYTVPCLLVTQSLLALAVICGTHIVIDRLRLAKYVVWAKNQLAPRRSARPSPPPATRTTPRHGWPCGCCSSPTHPPPAHQHGCRGVGVIINVETTRRLLRFEWSRKVETPPSKPESENPGPPHELGFPLVVFDDRGQDAVGFRMPPEA